MSSPSTTAPYLPLDELSADEGEPSDARQTVSLEKSREEPSACALAEVVKEAEKLKDTPKTQEKNDGTSEGDIRSDSDIENYFADLLERSGVGPSRPSAATEVLSQPPAAEEATEQDPSEEEMDKTIPGPSGVQPTDSQPAGPQPDMDESRKTIPGPAAPAAVQSAAVQPSSPQPLASIDLTAQTAPFVDGMDEGPARALNTRRKKAEKPSETQAERSTEVAQRVQELILEDNMLRLLKGGYCTLITSLAFGAASAIFAYKATGWWAVFGALITLIFAAGSAVWCFRLEKQLAPCIEKSSRRSTAEASPAGAK